MYFNFEENHPDTPRMASSLSMLERVLATVVVYLLAIIITLVLPKTEWYQARLAAQQKEVQEAQQKLIEKQRENARFVFMAPRVEMQRVPPPQRAELSDLDRRANSAERPPRPENPLPFSRGNSAERVDSASVGPREAKPEPAPAQPAGEPEANRPEMKLPESPNAAPVKTWESAKPRGTPTGILADAIRNVQKYASGETFNNPQGGAPNQNFPSIQFDSKGVEFGPWLRRFVAQIKRNWFIPDAAMFMKGHVVITFYVHKDGRITDLQVVQGAEQLGLQRPRGIEPDARVAARVSRQQSLLHRHLLLQRITSAMTLPTRVQQIGLLMLLAVLSALAVYRAL
jgi:outer membrane biosynthesis protein TonB